MRKQIFPVIVITVLTLVVWLFAEVESLGEDQPNAQLTFRSLGDPPEALVRPIDFGGNFSLEIRGSRGALQRARDVFNGSIVLSPGDPGVPDVNGVHTVSLLDALNAYPPLIETGVIIESVRPQRVQIQVDEIVEFEVAIKAELAGIVVDGEVTVQPSRATVRAPLNQVARIQDRGIQVTLDSDDIDRSQPGPRTKAVTLELPGTPEETRGVRLLTERATVSFSLVSTIENRSFASVPVQLMLASTTPDAWEIEIEETQQLITVQLRGPSETLNRLNSEGSRLIAVMSLSDLELSRGITEKAVSLFVLRDGLPVPLPEGVTTIDTLPSVRFTGTRLVEDGGAE